MTEDATNFEVFRDRNSKRRNHEATVSISQRGQMHLSGLAHELLGKPEAVVFLYNRSERMIGLRPAANGDEDAYACRLNSRKSATRTVSSSAFIGHIGLATEESRRWPLIMRDGIGTVDLKQPGTIRKRA